MSAPEIPDWDRIPEQLEDNTPSYLVFTKPIVKSEQDDREYRMIRLDNGLHAMLIHDAKADVAAASLDVAVGHLRDPDDMPGLAHFCEHLLFMGTEEYRDENEYSEFLTKHNGASNAYTSSSSTNFYFSVTTSAFSGALSRFSSFFRCPLFSPSCTTRELNAVDSEHKKNLQADSWRLMQIDKALSKEGHVWRKFGTGDKDTLSMAGMQLKAKEKLLNGITHNDETSGVRNGRLSPADSTTTSRASSRASSPGRASEGDGGFVGREMRRRLVEWWEKEYCASRMRLCVISNDSLDDLANLVSRLFSPVENRGQDPLPLVTEHPFDSSILGCLVSAQTILSVHALDISFPVKYQPLYYKYKPCTFVANFIRHEGPGSLFSYLKNKGWVTSLDAFHAEPARGFSTFSVQISLTIDGFHNYRAVMLALYKYIDLLRSSPFPAWCQKELASLMRMTFRFSEKIQPDDYAVWVSNKMSWQLPEELRISAPLLAQEWDEEGEAEGQVRDVLDCLRIEKGRAALIAKEEEHDKIAGKEKEWTTEPIYGTKYAVEKLDDDLIRRAQEPNDIPELRRPGPNKFIPTNFQVDKREVAKPLRRPYLIRDTPLSSLWHKKDDQFWVPKATVMIEIRSPLANSSARTSVLTGLFADLVNDALTEFSYDAGLAGLSYAFQNHCFGVWISLNGYNDKMGVLAKHVLEKVKGLVVDPVRLELMKEDAKENWDNFEVAEPNELSNFYVGTLLAKPSWTPMEKLAELSSITAEEVQEHITQLLSKVYILLFVGGNMHKEEAITIAEMTESILEPSPLSRSELLHRALVLPGASNFVWSTPVPNRDEPNSALSWYCRIGNLTEARRRVTAALLTQILSEPAFETLRTQEQLGYIVSCFRCNLAGLGESGLKVTVQSEKDPIYLQERVDVFLDGMKETIEKMSAEEFSQHKDGLAKGWKEESKNLDQEVNLFWDFLYYGYLDFFRWDDDADLLQSVTKEDVLSLFLCHIHPSSPTRSTIAAHLRSQKPRPQRVSATAATAFEELVQAAQLPFEEGGWRDELGSDEPAVDEFTKYWQGILGEAETGKELLEAIPRLRAEYPIAGEGERAIQGGVTVIVDVEAFKGSLKLSEPPRPLVEWNDLVATN